MKLPISSAGFGKRIVIRPQVSKTLVLLIVSVHAAALVLLFFIGLDGWILVALAALVLYNLVVHSSPAVLNKYSLSLQQGRPLLIETDTPGWQEVELVSTFMCDWMLLITVRERADYKQKITLIYARDSMAAITYRQIRTYLNQYSQSIK